MSYANELRKLAIDSLPDDYKTELLAEISGSAGKGWGSMPITLDEATAKQWDAIIAWLTDMGLTVKYTSTRGRLIVSWMHSDPQG